MAKDVFKMSDEELANVSAGASRSLDAAYSVFTGCYGNGEERKKKLRAAGYDPHLVQSLVNGIAAGYDVVARDVLNGRYGYGPQCELNLQRQGYNLDTVHLMVNHMLADY